MNPQLLMTIGLKKENKKKWKSCSAVGFELIPPTSTSPPLLPPLKKKKSRKEKRKILFVVVKREGSGSVVK